MSITFPNPPILREWLVFKEPHGLDWLGNPAFWYMLFTHVEGSDDYHWNGSYTHCSYGDNWIPVKSYGFFSKDSQFEDTINAAFKREFRMPKPVVPMLLADKDAPEGWLSPTGEWYPVEYGGHSAEADYICSLIIYNDPEWYGTGYTELHKRGWLSLHQGYILNDAQHEIGVTYSMVMLNVLEYFLAVCDKSNYKTHLQDSLWRVRDYVR